MIEKKLRRDALGIFRAALKAADPYEAVRARLRIPEGVRDVYVIGAGKASGPMALAAERALGKRIKAGAINTKYGHAAKLRRISITECGHPMPDRQGVAGTRRLVEIARSAGEGDLVICLISGGASALTPLPAAPLSLADMRRTTALLLASGADIHEINTVRKHLSEVQGGQLARLAAPARVFSLILSDVIGDDLDVIGSGPTVPDRSTFADAEAVLRRRGLWDKAPLRVRHRLEEAREETPKPGDPLFARVSNVIVGSNGVAMSAAAEKARSLGYRTLILSSSIEGEAREVAGVHTAILREIVASGNPVGRPACVISGGETTVTLQGKGKGGRNQEFVLAAVDRIGGVPGVVILSAGTDGTDGPTDAAGAVADGGTLARAEGLGMNAAKYLAKNDSYRYFDALGDLVKTGPTRTNVMDVRVMLAASLARTSETPPPS